MDIWQVWTLPLDWHSGYQWCHSGGGCHTGWALQLDSGVWFASECWGEYKSTNLISCFNCFCPLNIWHKKRKISRLTNWCCDSVQIHYNDGYTLSKICFLVYHTLSGLSYRRNILCVLWGFQYGDFGLQHMLEIKLNNYKDMLQSTSLAKMRSSHSGCYEWTCLLEYNTT